jgi:hypothetical protein
MGPETGARIALQSFIYRRFCGILQEKGEFEWRQAVF